MPTSAEPSGSAPAATPYPDPETQPAALTADLTEYPNYGEVDCEAGTFNNLPYAGNLKKISAPNPQTVVFEFCNPNVPFLSQIGFASLAIDDGQYLIDNMPTAITGEGEPLAEGSLLTATNGTGPYRLDTWTRGDRMTFTANETYWGEAAARTPNLEFRWSDQAAQRLIELQSGAVDIIDNIGKDDIPAVQGDSTLQFVARDPFNVLYFGMNNTFEPWDDLNVRKAIAIGIDRQRIVDNFMLPESTVASHFTPCDVPFGCAGPSFDEAYPFNRDEAIQMLRDAGIEEGYALKVQYRASVRPYIPDPPTIAQEVASQLTELGFNVTVEEQESGTFLDNNSAGTLDGLFLLGWIADYPDADNFLNYHFGTGTGAKFGDPIPELVTALRDAGQTADEAERERLYGEANRLVNENVPAVIVAHGTSAVAAKADIDNAYASPLGNELFNEMQAADRDLLAWMQNSEPLSLYCGDETDGETFRACLQIKEALYGYRQGDIDPTPLLAEECTPNEDATIWTCTLREGVTFHDGSTFEASDVIVSFAAQWDALSPQHVGRTAAFEYWPALIGGGFLNPPGPCGLPNTPACPPPA